MKINPYYRRQKFSQDKAYADNRVSFCYIQRGVKQQWGGRKRRVLAFFFGSLIFGSVRDKSQNYLIEIPNPQWLSMAYKVDDAK